MFATFSEIKIPLDYGTPESWSQQIKAMNRTLGSTWTKTALQTTFDQMWAPNLDSERIQMNILVTDGAPSFRQDPCDELDRYTENGIRLLVIAIAVP